MPSKRKITVSQRSAFWPCGSCRQNCRSDCIRCDTCKSWYHAQCEDLSADDFKFYTQSTAAYECERCFSIILGYSPYQFPYGLTRMRQWSATHGVDDLQVAAKREAKRKPPFDLYDSSTIPGEFVEVDMNAQYILDKCRLQSIGAPAKTTGDGNCLFNAVSIALTGYEKLATELRMRTAVEMAMNSSVYNSRADI